MTNQIHVEVYVDQIIGMAEKAKINYESKMIQEYSDYCNKVDNYNKNRNWVDKFICSKMLLMQYKEYQAWYSDKKFLGFISELTNLTRSKGTTGQKVNLSIDLDKWDMLTKYYGGFNESKTNML